MMFRLGCANLVVHLGLRSVSYRVEGFKYWIVGSFGEVMVVTFRWKPVFD